MATVKETRALVQGGAAFDVTVLDVNLPDGAVAPGLEALRARGVPALAYTGGTVPEDVQRRHPDLNLTRQASPACSSRRRDTMDRR